MTTVFIGGGEDILASHFMNEQWMDILIWGNVEEFNGVKMNKLTFEQWKARKTPEEIQKMIKTGIHPNVVAMMCGGKITLLD
jgi:hypothetical protein